MLACIYSYVVNLHSELEGRQPVPPKVDRDRSLAGARLGAIGRGDAITTWFPTTALRR